jgi:hypothetical protein
MAAFPGATHQTGRCQGWLDARDGEVAVSLSFGIRVSVGMAHLSLGPKLSSHSGIGGIMLALDYIWNKRSGQSITFDYNSPGSSEVSDPAAS